MDGNGQASERADKGKCYQASSELRESNHETWPIWHSKISKMEKEPTDGLYDFLDLFQIFVQVRILQGSY